MEREEEKQQRYGSSACERCRVRKRRCDRRFPQCTDCERAGVECLIADALSGLNVPQNYLLQVESRVAKLEDEISRRKRGQSTKADSSVAASHRGETAGVPFWRSIRSHICKLLKKDAEKEFIEVYPGPTTVPTWKAFEGEEERAFFMPSKYQVEEYLQRYFEGVNSEIPVLHREEFIKTYYEPWYGPISPGLQLASKYTDLSLSTYAGDPPPLTLYSHYKDTDLNTNPPPPHTHYSLYFLLQVFAIATTYSIDSQISERYHQQAMKYYHYVLRCPDRLVVLKAVVLLGVYCLARPAFPGLYQGSGMAMRMSVELGLNDEDNSWSKADPLTTDESRRLFWCSYILDRYVSMLLGRPTALSEIFINVREFSLADDSLLRKDLVVDINQLPTYPSYKHVSKRLISLLQIQQKVKNTLYGVSQISPQKLLELYDKFVIELNQWYQQLPADDKLTNFNFQVLNLDIMLQITRILLIRVAIPHMDDSKGIIEELMEAGVTIMNNFCTLRDQKKVNYAWVSANNIFIAATASLYALLHLSTVESGPQSERINKISGPLRGCMALLRELQNVCTNAAYSYDLIQETEILVMDFIASNSGHGTQQNSDTMSEMATVHDLSTGAIHMATEINEFWAAYSEIQADTISQCGYAQEGLYEPIDYTGEFFTIS